MMFALLFGLFAVAPAMAQSDSRKGDSATAPGFKVQTRLVPESGEVAPGGSVTIAFEQVIQPTWHTYWSNAGEAGYPTTLDWTLPPGWKAGPIAWPYPKQLSVPPLMDYGYEGTVWLLVKVTAPADARPGTIVTLKTHAAWLVCQTLCRPEDTVLSVPVSVSADPVAPYATTEAQFAAWRAKLPAKSPWGARFDVHDGHVDLLLASAPLSANPPKAMAFFPFAEGAVDNAKPSRLGASQDGPVLRMEAGRKAASATALRGVLVLTSQDNSQQALEIDAQKGDIPSPHFDARPEQSLLVAMLLALVGGLILNLMPCVLPILAMKALAIARKAHGDKREAATEGFAYGAGAVLSFMALGLAVVALRAGGSQVGWGFQLQEPAAVAGFALLVFVVGLNLSGVFELSSGVMAGDSLTRKSGWAGAFFTGVLAVAVAAPCTAPFMAAALGYALTQAAWRALLVFFALGLGFALPFVLVGLMPGLLRVLPKPGAWMLRFKQVLAFPMYGAAVWLVWVLSKESGDIGLIAVLCAMIALAFAAWVWTASREAAGRWRIAGAVFAALGLLAALSALVVIAKASVSPAAAAEHIETAGIPCENYSDSKLAQYRAAKRPVFVDATAAWCITCLVNERVALSGDTVHAVFASKHIAYLLADWTNRDAAITRLLESHGRSGVPLYLYYAPGSADAVVLPQVLTEAEVLKTVGN
ncbi:MAG TPA: thioredoxin family protein [Rhizomicrobium sp.]